MFYAGDDEKANWKAAGLTNDSGFEPVYVGSLKDVSSMEPPHKERALYGEESHLSEACEAIARSTGKTQ